MDPKKPDQDPSKRQWYALIKAGEAKLHGWLYTSDFDYWLKRGWSIVPAVFSA